MLRLEEPLLQVVGRKTEEGRDNSETRTDASAKPQGRGTFSVIAQPSLYEPELK